MPLWKIAALQLDCQLGDGPANLAVLCEKLRLAADAGVRLAIFPECYLTGYGFESKDEAWPHAEPLPGPSSDAVADSCRHLGVLAAYGLLERDEPTGSLFNSCALVGPDGLVATYRKVHLPLLGVDRFTTPGDRSFAVHDLGGLRVGMNICYDGSFPEAARALALLGADLILLPTNWPTGARSSASLLPPARALENHVYYAAVNRIGEERGFRYIGQSRILDWNGAALAHADTDQEALLLAEIDPESARRKRHIVIPGKHEVDRVGDRRPEMYGPLLRDRPSAPGPHG